MTEKYLVEVKYARGQLRGSRVIPKKDIYFDTLLEINSRETSLKQDVEDLMNEVNGYCTYVLDVKVLKKEKIA